ncbi:hypothetical protein NTE28_001333 [Vibrio harveyi]|nr:hypothetical protein [Vibrio harveyi]
MRDDNKYIESENELLRRADDVSVCSLGTSFSRDTSREEKKAALLQMQARARASALCDTNKRECYSLNFDIPVNHNRLAHA